MCHLHKHPNHLPYTVINWISLKWRPKDDLSVNYMSVQEGKWEWSPLSLSHTDFKSISPATNINILVWSRQIFVSPVSGWQPLMPSQILLQSLNTCCEELSFFTGFSSCDTRNCHNNWFYMVKEEVEGNLCTNYTVKIFTSPHCNGDV